MFSQTAQELTTVRDLLCFTVSRFNDVGPLFGHGSDNAHDETAYLILHTLNLPLDTLEPYLNVKLLQGEKEEVLPTPERRVVEHTPAAYLTHQTWQGEFDFYVNERVIIPRSLIYESPDDGIHPWIEHDELVHRALGLCASSGCLAIQVAHHYPDAQIDAVDLSLDTSEIVVINIEDYGSEDHINLVHTDSFEGLDETYDLIVSNPPYVDMESMETLSDEYLHEPELALGSGEGGLDVTRRIILWAAKYLDPKGVLLVRIDHNRGVSEVAYLGLPLTRLETSGGDGFVFLLACEQLLGKE